MKTVTIMRGPSGSGKSTYIRNHFNDDAIIVSADHFFEEKTEDGFTIYRFDPTQIGKAHSVCMFNFIRAIEKHTDEIVVDNTNIHKWEYANYKKIAEIAGYKVDIVEFRPNYLDDVKTCLLRNCHSVPVDVITRMCLEFEEDNDASITINIT